MENIKQEKKIVYSAIQATGIPSLGNYFGAIKNWKDMQNNYDGIFAIADLHSLTVRQDPIKFKKNARAMFLLLLALGLDPEKNIIYFQSHVHEHCELAWILNCFTYMGELNRMTQFKDKSKKHSDNINAGLFTYPVLMAADILLYGADFVPTGADQKQHIEICRNIAQRFNNIFGDIFKIPEPLINKTGARIMNLQEPNKKMSKSDQDGVIFLFEEKNVILNKIKKAVTDSGNKICFAEEKPGVSNLLNIYASAKNLDISQAENYFANKNYGELKKIVGEAVIELLEPIQKKYLELEKEKDYVDNLIKIGAERARKLAQKKLYKVKKKIGLLV